MDDQQNSNIYHVVVSGENIESLAFQYGHFGEVIWNHPNNASLKEKRRDPDVLGVGDIVFIPAIREKAVNCETNNVHRFQCRNTPAIFRFRPLIFGEPLTGEKYILVIDDGEPIEGIIGENGTITHYIRPDAGEAQVTVGSGVSELNYHLEFRVLPPVTEVPGIQARLKQLGFYHGELDGQNGPPTQDALALFQERQGLEATGIADEQSISALLQQHGR